MSDLVCRKTMRRCETPGMCSPWGGCADPAADELSRLRAENERLRERLEVYKQEVGDLGGVIVECEARITELEGERDTATRALEEMREALRWIASVTNLTHDRTINVAARDLKAIGDSARAALSKTEGKGDN